MKRLQQNTLIKQLKDLDPNESLYILVAQTIGVNNRINIPINYEEKCEIYEIHFNSYDDSTSTDFTSLVYVQDNMLIPFTFGYIRNEQAINANSDVPIVDISDPNIGCTITATYMGSGFPLLDYS